MKILKNLEKSGFSKIFIFLQIVLGVDWDIRGVRARAGTTPGGLIRRLRRPQGIARGAEVCSMSPAGAGRIDPVITNLKNIEKYENS